MSRAIHRGRISGCCGKGRRAAVEATGRPDFAVSEPMRTDPSFDCLAVEADYDHRR